MRGSSTLTHLSRLSANARPLAESWGEEVEEDLPLTLEDLTVL